MVEFTPRQNRMIASGLTVLAFAVIATFVFFVGWALVAFLDFAASALIPVVLGIFLAMFFRPYYAWFRARLGGSSLALVAMMASVLAPLGLLTWWGGSFVTAQVSHLVAVAPTIVERVSTWVGVQFPALHPFAASLGLSPEHQLFFTDPARFSHELVAELSSDYGLRAMKAGVGVLRHFSYLGTALVALIFFAYFVTRREMRGADLVREMPFLKDETKRFVAAEIDLFADIVVSFFQRQVVICLIEGALYGLGFTLVGLPYGFVLGFLLGALNLVPLMGSVLILPMALPIAYFGDAGSVWRLAGVLAVWLAGQVLDGYVITPRIQGEKTGLGYAGVIFSFFFWGVVFHSPLGLLLAIPLSAFCVVLWRALKETYIRGVI